MGKSPMIGDVRRLMVVITTFIQFALHYFALCIQAFKTSSPQAYIKLLLIINFVTTCFLWLP